MTNLIGVQFFIQLIKYGKIVLSLFSQPTNCNLYLKIITITHKLTDVV